MSNIEGRKKDCVFCFRDGFFVCFLHVNGFEMQNLVCSCHYCLPPIKRRMDLVTFLKLSLSLFALFFEQLSLLFWKSHQIHASFNRWKTVAVNLNKSFEITVRLKFFFHECQYFVMSPTFTRYSNTLSISGRRFPSGLFLHINKILLTTHKK